MEKIIKTLSEIDMKSSKIMEATNNEKQALEDTFKKRKEQYKNEAKTRTATEVDALRKELNTKMQAQLFEQAEAAKKLLEDLDCDYQKNHDKIAADIFYALTEV